MHFFCRFLGSKVGLCIQLPYKFNNYCVTRAQWFLLTRHLTSDPFPRVGVGSGNETSAISTQAILRGCGLRDYRLGLRPRVLLAKLLMSGSIHGGGSDPVNCTSVAIASISKQLCQMPHVVRESFVSGGMNFCLVPSVWGVSDASDTGVIGYSTLPILAPPCKIS